MNQLNFKNIFWKDSVHVRKNIFVFTLGYRKVMTELQSIHFVNIYKAVALKKIILAAVDHSENFRKTAEVLFFA